MNALLLFIQDVDQQMNEIRPPDLGSLQEPDRLQFAFNTPAWQFLFFILFIVFVFMIIGMLIKYQKNQYRRDAIKLVGKVEIGKLGIDHLFIILKVIAQDLYGKQEVASLKGEEWLIFLDSKCKQSSFQEHHQSIQAFVYAEEPFSDREKGELIDQTKKWVKHHVA